MYLNSVQFQSDYNLIMSLNFDIKCVKHFGEQAPDFVYPSKQCFRASALHLMHKPSILAPSIL